MGLFVRPAAERPSGRLAHVLRDTLVHLLVILATLGVLEAILRVVDFRDLRDGYRKGNTIVFRYDQELGWSPVPNSVAQFQDSRSFQVRHNSLGLRDIEPGPPARPTLVVMGDSFVWGYDVEAKDRFTEQLRSELPGLTIVNAGVPGYGTDQEFLLLKRIWDRIRPDIVLLMFCVDNDRADNMSNRRYGGYFKPYATQGADGLMHFAGQPVPRSRFAYFTDNPLVHNLWVARLAVSAFIEVRHPEISLPDRTEQLVGMMQSFVEARSATFLVGIQRHEPQLETYLQARRIDYASFDGVPSYSLDGAHWTPDGHAVVARRLKALLEPHVMNLVERER